MSGDGCGPAKTFIRLSSLTVIERRKEGLADYQGLGPTQIVKGKGFEDFHLRQRRHRLMTGEPKLALYLNFLREDLL
jgi:hypothetical protein